MEEFIKHKAALKREIAYLTLKLDDLDNEHIRTTVLVLEQRIKDIDDFIDSIHRRAFDAINRGKRDESPKIEWDLMVSNFNGDK